MFPGLSRRILRRHDAKLLAIRANHANFPCADPLIHLDKAFIYAILLNPAGKLTLLVELRGRRTHAARLGDYNMGFCRFQITQSGVGQTCFRLSIIILLVSRIPIPAASPLDHQSCQSQDNAISLGMGATAW